MTTAYNFSLTETDIKIAQRAYEFYLKEYPSILRQDFTNRHSALLGKNKKQLLDEHKIQESKINVFKKSIAYNNHLKLALNLSKTINSKNKPILNQITKDAIISRLEEKNIDYAAVENLIEVFKIKRSELQEGIVKTIKKDLGEEDTYDNAVNLAIYFKQDLGNRIIEIYKKLLEKAADICLESSITQDGQKKNLDFLYETSNKLSLTHEEVAELLNVHIKEKLKEYILFELNSQIYEPGRYKDEVLHENVKTIASILNLDDNEFKNIVINTVTDGMADRLNYITNSSLKFNSYLINVLKIAKQHNIANEGILNDKLKDVIINSIIRTDIYEEWNGSHSEFTTSLSTVIDLMNIARQHGIINNNDLKDKILDVIKSEELYRLESLRHWMFGYYEYDLDYYKDNSKAFEKIKTAFSLTDLDIKDAMAKAKKEIKDADDYFEDLEKKEKAMEELKRIDARFRAAANRRNRILIEGSYQPMGLCQFLRTFLPL